MPYKSIWKNYPAGIAVAVGIALLVTSYAVTGEHSVWHHVTHELGFALVVAVLVWFIFEVGSRAEITKEWNDRIDRISRNVFFSVLGRNMSQDYIDEVQLVALDRAFERTEFFITYILSNDTFIDRRRQVSGFVRMEAMTRIKMKNVGIKPEKYSIMIGLPNPIIDELKEHCRISRAAYRRNGEDYIDIDVRIPNKFLQDNLVDDNDYQINVACGDQIELMPGEEIEIKQEFCMAKEEEDTEIVQTLYPTDSCLVTIVDRCPEKRIVRARAIHRGSIDADLSKAESGIHVFRIEKPLLPFQGFAVFWKRRPTGLPAVAGVQKPIDDAGDRSQA